MRFDDWGTIIFYVIVIVTSFLISQVLPKEWLYIVGFLTSVCYHIFAKEGR